MWSICAASDRQSSTAADGHTGSVRASSRSPGASSSRRLPRGGGEREEQLGRRGVHPMTRRSPPGQARPPRPVPPAPLPAVVADHVRPTAGAGDKRLLPHPPLPQPSVGRIRGQAGQSAQLPAPQPPRGFDRFAPRSHGLEVFAGRGVELETGAGLYTAGKVGQIERRVGDGRRPNGHLGQAGRPSAVGRAGSRRRIRGTRSPCPATPSPCGRRGRRPPRSLRLPGRPAPRAARPADCRAASRRPPGRCPRPRCAGRAREPRRRPTRPARRPRARRRRSAAPCPAGSPRGRG